MPRVFPNSTAELTLAATRAVVVAGTPLKVDAVARFIRRPDEFAEGAADLAHELGLLDRLATGEYAHVSPLARFLDTVDPIVSAAVLRVALAGSDVFEFYVSRLRALDGRVTDAAEQTVALLDLDTYDHQLSQTLNDLGTFAQVLQTTQPGRVALITEAPKDLLEALAQLANDVTANRAYLHDALGLVTTNSTVSDEEVIEPLLRAVGYSTRHGESTTACQQAGNAVESMLVEYGSRNGVTVNAAGITKKAEQIRGANAALMPKKLLSYAHFLSDGRNAADHGVDPELNGSSWNLSERYGVIYVAASIEFIRSVLLLERQSYEL